MQNIDLICVGKVNAPYFAAGVAEYQKRLGAFCNFRIIELPEAAIAEKNAGETQIRKALQKEGSAILSSLRKGEYLAALCIEGKQFSSEELAALINKKFSDGYGEITFLIGGSNGTDPEILKKADKRVSFGRVTYPHQLMRVILAEQIYRAVSILNNLPYHK